MMQEQSKLVFLVISAEAGVYGQLQQCWREWFAQNSDCVRVFLVHADAGAEQAFLKDDMTLVTPGGESLIPGVLDKTVAAMQFVQQHYQYDYLVRTNLSSFWLNSGVLRQYFRDRLGNGQCYAGYIGKHGDQLFVSGAGIIMSPDVVGGIVEQRSALDRGLPDDVAIGRLVQQRRLARLQPLQDSRHDIIRYGSMPDEETMTRHLDFICSSRGLTHVRLKNPDRNIDVEFYRRMLERQRRGIENASATAGCRL